MSDDERQAEPGPPDDLEALAEGAGAPARPGHPAAYAANWRRVIMIDLSMGLLMVVAGAVLVLVWNVLIGAMLGGLGAAYSYAVWRRYHRWRAQREAAGLPT